jgi:hypothetical protein
MPLKNPATPPGIDPGTVQLVAQRLNDYATPGPEYSVLAVIKRSVRCVFNLFAVLVCLFSWSYNQLRLYFHSPIAGFSLLVFEVS